jgi:tetratricopeptide (TPR) repeat protein
MLRWFVTVVALAFGTGALTVSLFWAASLRYEVEFLPELVLLAVVGILGLERVLAPTSESGLADRPVRRRAVRWGWGLLLAFSVVFNVLVSVEHYAYESCSLGTVLTDAGRVPEGIKVLQKALRIKPDNAEAQFNLGIALQQTGNLMEAMGEYEQALRINPDYAEAHCNLGIALGQTGRMEDAIGHYEQALRIRPDFAEAHCNLGIALEMVGRTTEAIEHYQQALKLRPDFAPARNALARLQAGQ